MATQVDPHKLSNLFNRFRGTDEIRRYLQMCFNNGVDPRLAINRISSSSSWSDFFTKIPLADVLVDALHINGALSEDQYIQVLEDSDKIREARPVGLPDLPDSSIVPRSPLPRPTTPAVSGPRALANRQRALREHRKKERERQKIVEAYDEADSGISSTPNDVESHKKRLKALIKLRENALKLNTRHSRAMGQDRVQTLRLTSGSPPHEIQDVRGSDVINVSKFIDQDGIPRADLLERARRDTRLHTELEATLALREGELEAKMAARRAEVVIKDAISQVAGNPTLINNRDLAHHVENIAKEIAPELVAAAEGIRKTRKHLDKAGEGIETFSRLYQHSGAARAPIEREIRTFYLKQLGLSTRATLTPLQQAEVDELVEKATAATTAALEAAGKTLTPQITVDWQPHQDDGNVGINEQIKVINQGQGNDVEVKLYEQLLSQNPILVANGAPDPTSVLRSNPYLRHAFEQAETRRLQERIRELGVSENLVDNITSLEEFRQFLKDNPGISYIPPKGKPIPAKQLYEATVKGRRSRQLQLSENYASRIRDEASSFTENPIGYVFGAGFKLAGTTLLPRSAYENLEKFSDFLSGKQAVGKVLPYLDSSTYTTSMLTHWLSQITGWVEVTPTGKLTIGPIKWMNYGFRSSLFNAVQNPRIANWLNIGYERNYLDSLIGKGRTGLSFRQARRAFNLDFSANLKAQRGKAIERYVSGQIGILSALFSLFIGSGIKAAANWVLEKTGLMKVVQEVTEMTRRVTDAWKFGGGISTQAYARRANMEWVGGNKIRGFGMKTLSGFGRFGLKPLRTGMVTSRILLGTAARSIGIYALGTMLLGANPITTGAFAASYFGVKTVQNILSDSYFAAKYLGKVAGFRNFYLASGAVNDVRTLTDLNRHLAVANRLASVDFLGLSIGKYHPGIARLFQAYNTSIFQWKNFSFSRKLKAFSFITRNIPIDGAFFSFMLGSLGAPWYIAAAPIGIDLLSKGLRAIQIWRSDKILGRLLAKPFAPISLAFDTFIGIFALEEAGGIMGLFNKIALEGFTWQNISRIFGVLSPGVGMAGFVMLIGGGPSVWTVLAASAVFNAAVIVVDEIFRKYLGQSLWQYLWPKIEGLLKRFFGDIGKGVVGVGSLVMGLIGVIQSLLRGDPMGIAISIAFLIIGGSFVVNNFSTSTFPASSFTTVSNYQVTSNAFLSNANKTFDSNHLNTHEDELKYFYSFEVGNFYYIILDGDVIEISDIELTEIDEFTTEGGGNIREIFDMATIDNQNFSFDLTEEKYTLTYDKDGASYNSEETKSREFTIKLKKPLKNLLPPNAKLCNTLKINIDSVENNGEEVEHNQEDIMRKICINRTGQITNSRLSTLPIDPTFGTITSCYGPRGNGYHHGFDIAAPPGTSIFAVGDGTITNIDFAPNGFGHFIKIYHNNETYSLYAHMKGSSIVLDEGDNVLAGDKIGEVWNTGYTVGQTGHHLHLGLYTDTPAGQESFNPCLEPVLNLCNSYRYNSGMSECDINNNPGTPPSYIQ